LCFVDLHLSFWTFFFLVIALYVNFRLLITPFGPSVSTNISSVIEGYIITT
jgi:hypothetical protein